MHSTPSLDSGKPYDWGRTSDDYASYRPGYPASFYIFLEAIGVGQPGQRVLDIATGPGVVALPLARRGARVIGVDIAENQIAEARRLATERDIEVDFRIADAQSTNLPSGSFDVITASMCMHYFNPVVILPEIKRMLTEGGRFLVASLIYLPRKSTIASQTEQLILKYNPSWGGADFSGEVSTQPRWSQDHLKLQTFHRYIENVRFSSTGWRGRIRACRGIGASLSPKDIETFDHEHGELLDRIADTEFTVPHLITVHVFSCD